MMEKDNESITTVQMKPEYAASEVYSTVSGSEPPPVSKSRWKLQFIVCRRFMGFTGQSPITTTTQAKVDMQKRELIESSSLLFDWLNPLKGGEGI